MVDVVETKIEAGLGGIGGSCVAKTCEGRDGTGGGTVGVTVEVWPTLGVGSGF